MAGTTEKAIYGGVGLILAIVWGLYLFEFFDLGCMGVILLSAVTIIFVIFMFRRPPKRSSSADESIGETVSRDSGRGGLT